MTAMQKRMGGNNSSGVLVKLALWVVAEVNDTCACALHNCVFYANYTMQIRLLTFIAALCLALLSACTIVNPHYDPSKPHHTTKGFKNIYSEGTGGFGNFLKWQWERFNQTIAKPTADLSPVIANLELIHGPKKAQITWIGHASALVQMGGFNILTDPIFSDRASPVQFAGPKRFQAPGLSLAQLPPIDAVVISHNHYDHLDLDSVSALAALPNAPVFYVPLGIDTWFKAHVPNAKVFKTDWQEKHVLTKPQGNLALHFLPIQHWSSRTPFDRLATLWGSWALMAGDKAVWFSGDLGYSQDTANIGKQFPKGFDLSLIAVGAYEPRWFMKGQHINPAEAVTIHREIGSRKSVGIHWGTFTLTDEPLDQPIADLAAAKKDQSINENSFILLRHGQTTEF
jgi:L-ascorbate metabolism protein UlaG (beta-lactamase superfamily)